MKFCVQILKIEQKKEKNNNQKDCFAVVLRKPELKMN